MISETRLLGQETRGDAQAEQPACFCSKSNLTYVLLGYTETYCLIRSMEERCIELSQN